MRIKIISFSDKYIYFFRTFNTLKYFPAKNQKVYKYSERRYQTIVKIINKGLIDCTVNFYDLKLGITLIRKKDNQ